MTDSPGQRCVRECRHVFIVETALDGRASQLGACAACIDAAIDARTELMEAEARHAALVIVRRERAGALKRAAHAALGVDVHDDFTRRQLADWLRARAAQEERGDG